MIVIMKGGVLYKNSVFSSLAYVIMIVDIAMNLYQDVVSMIYILIYNFKKVLCMYIYIYVQVQYGRLQKLT